MSTPRTLTTAIEKTDVDQHFNELKRQVYNIIEASVPQGQQRASIQLARTAINDTRITMLRWLGLEAEGEYRHAARRNRDPRPTE
jgi:hypothetical protein